jgi:hypothetical protein
MNVAQRNILAAAIAEWKQREELILEDADKATGMDADVNEGIRQATRAAHARVARVHMEVMLENDETQVEELETWRNQGEGWNAENGMDNDFMNAPKIVAELIAQLAEHDSK